LDTLLSVEQAAERLGTISAQVVQRWQNELEGRASHNLTMACRSILNRILDAAEAERLIPVNPVRKVHAPKRPVDPEVVFGRVRRRAYTPEEFGRFLAGCPAFYRDHFLVQAGTGLRSGELLGLRVRRVDLEARRVEVVDVRYDAGRFGSGYKDRPKTDASIRAVPMAEPVAAAMARRLAGCGRDELVFCGPGGSNGVPVVSAPDCRSATTRACTGWRWPGPSCPSWTRTARTTCATPSVSDGPVSRP
jgi:integrase